jgi:hypothetical protein
VTVVPFPKVPETVWVPVRIVAPPPAAAGRQKIARRRRERSARKKERFLGESIR